MTRNWIIDVLIIVIFLQTIMMLVIGEKLNRLEDKVVTLQSYNEEVWRTFKQMKEIHNGIQDANSR